jgi:tRNA1(Val) A37 N6-methylase TrmN6
MSDWKDEGFRNKNAKFKNDKKNKKMQIKNAQRNKSSFIYDETTNINDIPEHIKNTDLHIHTIVEIAPNSDKSVHLIFIQFAKILPTQLEKKLIFIRNKHNIFTPESYKILHPFYKIEALTI